MPPCSAPTATSTLESRVSDEASAWREPVVPPGVPGSRDVARRRRVQRCRAGRPRVRTDWVGTRRRGNGRVRGRSDHRARPDRRHRRRSVPAPNGDGRGRPVRLEEAMANSNLPETGEFAAQLAPCCATGPPTFRNLKVLRERTGAGRGPLTRLAVRDSAHGEDRCWFRLDRAAGDTRLLVLR